MNMPKPYTIIAILLLIGIALQALILCNKPIVKIEKKHTRDTVSKVVYDTTYVYLKLKGEKIKKYENPSPSDSIKEYADTLSNDTVSVFLFAKATKLIESKLSYELNIPERTIRKDSIVTIYDSVTNIVTKRVPGVNLNVGVSSQFGNNLDFGPAVNLNLPKFNIGYGYNFLSKSHQITLTVPIIKPKD